MLEGKSGPSETERECNWNNGGTVVICNPPKDFHTEEQLLRGSPIVWYAPLNPISLTHCLLTCISNRMAEENLGVFHVLEARLGSVQSYELH